MGSNYLLSPRALGVAGREPAFTELKLVFFQTPPLALKVEWGELPVIRHA